ncbi:hypothetical protein [Streptomyces sp. NRRL S-813]|uniref:hypothetical protein n=1 Tax=Streptomyces sp. NRRL S-813 TaxID=1463919 RepID=UPI00131A950A|nr:hypothetical protein [Streptomyces sp. NRRL S-813]
MPDPIRVKITRNELSVQEPDQTIISSIELVNALVVEPADAWQSLAATFGVVVSTDNVRVTEDGRITIRNATVTKQVKDLLDSPGGAVGGCIGFLCVNYKCAEV